MRIFFGYDLKDWDTRFAQVENNNNDNDKVLKF